MKSTPVRIGLALVACAALVLPLLVACSSSEQSGGDAARHRRRWSR